MGIAYLALAWLLTEVAGTLFPGFGVPDWAFRFVVIVLALSFIPVLIFSWAYEITPEGIKREAEVVRDESITHLTAKRLDTLTISLVIAAFVFIVVDRQWLSQKQSSQTPAVTEPAQPESVAAEAGPGSAPNSIAVLPFVNMSNDPDNEYFSDGISEELLNVLVKIPGLRVPSRTSSFAFKGEEKTLSEIAEVLEVEHVLEGSVRKAGNTVRVTAQLIEVSTDTHLWSETYDRELIDIFAIQGEIANSIVSALTDAIGAQLGPANFEAPTEDIEAYQLYLRGRHLWWTRYGDAVPRSVESLKRAVEADPEFARAWSGLAAAYKVISTYTDFPNEMADSLAMEAANRALALDPGIAEAQAVVAQYLADQGRFIEAATAFQKAVELDETDVLSHAWYGLFLSTAGYLDEARVSFELVLDLDPINGLAQGHLAILNEFLGDRSEALRYSYLAERTGMQFGTMVRYDIAIREGRYDEAYAIVRDFLAAYGSVNPCLNILQEALEREEVREAATECIDQRSLFGSGADWYLPEYDLQLVAPTIERLERGGNPTFNAALQWVWGPRGRFIRQSVEFRDFAERTGLVEFWSDRGWPDLCRPMDSSFICD